MKTSIINRIHLLATCLLANAVTSTALQSGDFTYEVNSPDTKNRRYSMKTMVRMFIATAICLTTVTTYAGQTPIWSEEFNYTAAPDSDVWSYDLGDWGWGNQELQNYTSDPSNVWVDGSNLVITALRSGDYISSARIKTLDKLTFKYGTVEARIQTPNLANGLWPAFWMLGNNFPYVGWPKCGEIDIMEMGSASAITAGVVNRRVGSAAHWDNDGAYALFSRTKDLASDLDGSFHIYRMDWTPTDISTYIDDQWIWSTSIDTADFPFKTEYHEPQFFILNLAVGGRYTGIIDPGDISAPFPAEYLVDYIRVFDNGYTVLGGSSVLPPVPPTPYFGTPQAIPGTLEAENYDNGGQGNAYNDVDGKNQGNKYRIFEGVDIESCTEGGYNVGWMVDAEWMKYTVDVAAAGNYRITSRVARGITGTGSFHIEVDDVNLTGSIPVWSTGGWQNWVDKTANVTLTNGVQVVKIVIERGNININYFEFEAVGDFTYTVNDGEATITGYAGTGGNVDIPGTINSLPVTTIGDASFYSCTSLTAITIPDSVTTIGNDVFAGCSSLMTIAVATNNPSYSSNGGILFDKSQATLLQYPGGKVGSYTIPSSVTSIGNSAFSGCANLTSVTIPDSVTSIGSYAFIVSTNLTAITVNESNAAYSSFDGVLFNKDQTMLLRCPEGKAGNYNIPASVTAIGDWAFYNCSSLTSVTIGNSVTTIGDGAFGFCYALTSVTIPASVTAIGDWAFGFCYALTSIYFDGNAPSTGSNLFYYTDQTTVYYRSGTTDWGTMFEDRPAVHWNPLIQTDDGNFGVQSGEFGFNIAGHDNELVNVETCTNLIEGAWDPVSTINLTDGAAYFSDPDWTSHPVRYYMLDMP